MSTSRVAIVLPAPNHSHLVPVFYCLIGHVSLRKGSSRSVLVHVSQVGPGRVPFAVSATSVCRNFGHLILQL